MRRLVFLALPFALACADKDRPAETGGDETLDADGDGVPAVDDCDDNNASNFPGNTERCDGVDNDCDGLADDADDSLDLGTATSWYADADEDGYGSVDASLQSCVQPEGYVLDTSDCDDSDAQIHPDAEEICDGVDNDCDSSTSEDGLASFIDRSGAVSDVTGSVSGTSANPAGYVVDTDGELAFCDGTFYVHLTVEADVDVSGVSGDAQAAILDGGGKGSVLEITTDGVEVGVGYLTLQNGFGNTSALVGDSAGGGILCEVSSSATLSVDDAIVRDNEAMVGGGIWAYGCAVDVTATDFTDNRAVWGGALVPHEADLTLEGVTLEGNDADLGGAIWHSDGRLTFTDVTFIENTAEVVAGVWASNSDLVFKGTEFSGNASTTAVGALYAQSSVLKWTGSADDSSGVNNNTDGEIGALVLQDTKAKFTSVDFGEPGVGDDNSPYDVVVYDSSGDELRYLAGDDQTFVCDEDACGGAIETVVEAANSSSSNYLLGLEILATTDGTLNHFAPLTHSTGGCPMDAYVLESSSGGSGSWTVIWASTGNAPATSSGYQDSGTVGLPVTRGNSYALMWDHAGCPNAIDVDYAANGTVSNLGTVQGTLYNTNNAVYGEGDSVSLAYSNLDVEMKISVTDL